ncbi:MAG: hypothetical protein R2729_05525 [Bryobacteraceae bacterium]
MPENTCPFRCQAAEAAFSMMTGGLMAILLAGGVALAGDAHGGGHGGPPTHVEAFAEAHEEMPPPMGERKLTNEGLVLLARAGYNERFLAELVRIKPTDFDTSVEGLVYLAKQGISERLVRAIVIRRREDEARAALESATPLDLSPTGHAPEPLKPVRLRVVKRNVLVPEDPKVTIAPGSVIVEERGAYWAKPVSTGPLSQDQL